MLDGIHRGSGADRAAKGVRLCAKTALILGAAGVLALTTATATVGCPIERARYRMVHDPSFTAGFRPVRPYAGWPSDVLFFVHSKAKQRTYWFMFRAASTAHIELISTERVWTKDWRPPASASDEGPLLETK